LVEETKRKRTLKKKKQGRGPGRAGQELSRADDHKRRPKTGGGRVAIYFDLSLKEL